MPWQLELLEAQLKAARYSLHKASSPNEPQALSTGRTGRELARLRGGDTISRPHSEASAATAPSTPPLAARRGRLLQRGGRRGRQGLCERVWKEGRHSNLGAGGACAGAAFLGGELPLTCQWPALG